MNACHRRSPNSRAALLIGYGNERVVDEAIASLLSESAERPLEADTSRIVK
jgi:hypothetical protein